MEIPLGHSVPYRGTIGEPNGDPWPSNLMRAIKSVINSHCDRPSVPDFQFKMTKEAAEKNFLVMKRHGMHLGNAIEAQKSSPLGYGSEFRKTETLRPLFGKHPNWSRMNRILENGSNWPLSELANDARASDLEEALTFGNHKGAEEKPDLLRKLVEKDITHGYGLVLPLKKVRRIPGLLMAPMNIQKQDTIDETGRIVNKDRLTHDQSYEWGSGTSVNSRLDKSELLPCMFGNMSKRILNWIVAARGKYPGVPIKCCKLDFKSAYRREHLNWETAVQTCTCCSKWSRRRISWTFAHCWISRAWRYRY